MKNKLLILFFLCMLGCKRQTSVYPFQQENIEEEGLTIAEDSVIAAQPPISLKFSDILLDNGETVEQFLLRTNPSALNFSNTRPHLNQARSKKIIARDALETIDDKETFISNQLIMAQIIGDITFTKPAEDPIDMIIKNKVITFKRPMQIGRGYAYNGDIGLSERKVAGNCPLLLYGIDCSGMVTNMLINAGVLFDGKYRANLLATEEILNSSY